MSAVDQPAFSRRIAMSGELPAAPFEHARERLTGDSAMLGGRGSH